VSIIRYSQAKKAGSFMARPPRNLPAILESLEALYGEPPPPSVTDPMQMILWENVAYLVSEKRRGQAFRAFKERVGTSPAKILKEPKAVIREVA